MRIQIALCALFLTATAYGKGTYSVPNAYTRLSFAGFSLESSFKIPTKDFKTQPDFYTPTFRAAFNAKELLSVPFTVAVGNLALCGGSSKLSSPALYSSGSAFSAVKMPLPVCVARLAPAATERPLAIYNSFDYKAPKSTLSRFFVSQYASDEDRTAQNILFCLKPAKQTELTFSLIHESFLAQNTNSSWFCDTPFFLEQKQEIYSFQSGIKTAFCKATAIVNLYQANHEFSKNMPLSFLTEQSLFLGNFTLNAAAFYATDLTTFTARPGILNTTGQVKIQPSYTFFTNKIPSKIMIGGTFLLEEKRLSATETEFHKKFKAESTVRTKKTESSISFLVKDSPAEKIYTGNAGFSYFSRMRPKATFSVSHSDKTKKSTYSIKCRQSLTAKTKQKTATKKSVNGTFSAAFTQSICVTASSKELKKITAELALSAKKSTRHITLGASARITYPLNAE